MNLDEARSYYWKLEGKLNKGGLARQERRRLKGIRQELLEEFGSSIRRSSQRVRKHITLRKPVESLMLVLLLSPDGEPARIIEVEVKGGLYEGSARWPKLRHEAAARALRQVALEIEKG